MLGGMFRLDGSGSATNPSSASQVAQLNKRIRDLEQEVAKARRKITTLEIARNAAASSQQHQGYAAPAREAAFSSAHDRQPASETIAERPQGVARWSTKASESGASGDIMDELMADPLLAEGEVPPRPLNQNSWVSSRVYGSGLRAAPQKYDGSGDGRGPKRSEGAGREKASCTFKDDTDYDGEDMESGVEGETPEGCCQLCAKRNRMTPGSCVGAVLSSRSDTPPKACWLKSRIYGTRRKSGVMACTPK